MSIVTEAKAPTPGELIARTAVRALHKDIPGIPTKPGRCLAFVRVVVQEALGITYNQFYSYKRMVERLTPDTEPWARDMERGLKAAGMEVPLERYGPEGDPSRYVVLDESRLEPGDILFRWDTARNKWGDYVGHVGIYLGNGLLIENIDPKHRPNSAHSRRLSCVAVTVLGEWPVTTVIRWKL